MIVITGSILAKPETLEELKRQGIEHSKRSRAEPGCLAHNIHVDCENPLRLVFVEHWADAAAVKTHFLVPASGAFVKHAATLASTAPDMAIYETKEVAARDIMR